MSKSPPKAVLSPAIFAAIDAVIVEIENLHNWRDELAEACPALEAALDRTMELAQVLDRHARETHGGSR